MWKVPSDTMKAESQGLPRGLWARIQRGVLHGWFVVVSIGLPIAAGALWTPTFADPGSLVFAIGAVAWSETIVCSSYLYALMDIDRRSGHVDSKTERRGKRAQWVLGLSFGLFAAACGIIWLTTSR
jgi:hypothetical protein